MKLTKPVTAILYITEDKQHMEELHKAIHVKEVVEGIFSNFVLLKICFNFLFFNYSAGARAALDRIT